MGWLKCDKVRATPTCWGLKRTTIHHQEVRSLPEQTGHTCTGRGTLLEHMEEGKINRAEKVGPEGGACRTGNWLKGLERKGGKVEKDLAEQHEEMKVDGAVGSGGIKVMVLFSVCSHLR